MSVPRRVTGASVLHRLSMKFASAALFTFALLGGLLTLAPTSATAAAGDLDVLNLNITGTQVNAMAVQPDGKLIIGGSFTQVLGVARANLARLNADGTLDTTFDPRPDGPVNAVAVQADGRIVLGGGFTSLQPNGGASVTRYYAARVNTNGTVEAGLTHVFNLPVYAIAMQPDGKILVGGEFQTVDDLSYDNLVRLNVDGTLDTAFWPRPLGTVYCVAVQADGKIVLGGAFSVIAPSIGFGGTRQRIARLNADGSMDSDFNPRANDVIKALVVQADGKILLGGDFTNLRPGSEPTATTRNRVARVNADGTLDTSFNPNASASVSSFALQADGKVLAGGAFTVLSPNGGSAVTRNRIARLNTDGTLDSAFNPNANGTVNAVALQADGRALVGGSFTTLTPNGGAAGTRNLSATGSTSLSWTRGGTTPEVTDVTFEQSTNSGSTWTSLGAGTRVAGGWQRSGLSLPATVMLRARGRSAGALGSGSAGIIEQVITLPVNVAENAVKTWAAGLGVPAGSQGLLDDPDADGQFNLQEFAFGTSPLSGAGGALVYSGSLAGGGTLGSTGQPTLVSETVGSATQWHALFIRRTNHVAAGIVYTGSFSANMTAWETSAVAPTVLADDGTYQVVRIPFPALVGGNEARFFRLSVSAAP